MCSRKQKETPKTLIPPYVFALYDFDPHTSGQIYDQQTNFAAPDVGMQLSFKRGDRLMVLSGELNWWILCKHVTSDEQGYVPSLLLAPVCVYEPGER